MNKISALLSTCLFLFGSFSYANGSPCESALTQFDSAFQHITKVRSQWNLRDDHQFQVSIRLNDSLSEADKTKKIGEIRGLLGRHRLTKTSSGIFRTYAQFQIDNSRLEKLHKILINSQIVNLISVFHIRDYYELQFTDRLFPAPVSSPSEIKTVLINEDKLIPYIGGEIINRDVDSDYNTFIFGNSSQNPLGYMW
jgi:hypothetical protein